MKKVVIYSSLSGNTQKIALAIAQQLGADAFKFDDERLGDLEDYDFVAVGFYVDKGDIDAKFKAFLRQNLKNKRVGLFIISGGDPSGEYGTGLLKMGKQTLEQNANVVVREFICQGAVSDEVMARMRQIPNYATPEREAKWAASKSHPDQDDIRRAMEVFAGIF